MSLFPAQDGTGLCLIEVRLGKAVQGPLGGDMVIQNEEFLGFGGHRFQNGSGIAEVNDHDTAILEVRRRGVAMFDG